MVERNPWWKNVTGPFPKWEGPIGCKEDGGGSHRGRGTVGKMLIHRAVNNHDKERASPTHAKTKRPIARYQRTDILWTSKSVAITLLFAGKAPSLVCCSAVPP